MSNPRRMYPCLRCGIDVHQYRGVCMDCQSFVRRHDEAHLWFEPKQDRIEKMKFLNQIGVVPNPIKAKRDRRYAG